MVHGFSWLSAPYPRRKCSTASTLFAPSPSLPFSSRARGSTLSSQRSHGAPFSPQFTTPSGGSYPSRYPSWHPSVCLHGISVLLYVYIRIYIYVCLRCSAERARARAFVVGLLLLSIGEEIKKEIVSSRCFKLPFITTHKPETRAEKSYARSGHLVPPSSRGGGG